MENTFIASLGYIIGLVGFIWLVILAFQRSVAWGIFSLLIPLVAFFYGLAYFSQAKTPFILMVIGSLLAGMGIAWGR